MKILNLKHLTPLHLTAFFGSSLILILYFLPEFHPLLRFDRIALSHGQWWRLFSNHWVHLNWAHCIMNLTGFTLLCLTNASIRRQTSLFQFFLLYLSLSFLISFLLYILSPKTMYYVGLSAVLHGHLVFLMTQQLPQMPILGTLSLLMITIKLLAEQYVPEFTHHLSLLINGKVAVNAHLFGSVIGLTIGLLSILSAKMSSLNFRVKLVQLKESHKIK